MSDFNAGTIMMIVADHDGYVWVMSPRDASRLRKIGYEVLC